MKKLYLIICLGLLVLPVIGQNVVTGTVTDAENGEALPGVSIRILNTTKGAITDLDGNYSVEVSEDAQLQFSFIGYKMQTIDANGRSTINVQLAVDVETLSEVVVVGYGQIKKSDLTGSVSSIKGEELSTVPTVNPVDALQGKVAGVQITNSSGAPGSSPIVRIRGIGTSGNPSPIYVVDGVIIASERNTNPLDFLNPNDIASVEVLKDASATAIYGSRGSNGVILITSKQGQQGDVRVNFSAEHSWESMANKIQVMDGREFATYVNAFAPGTYNNLDILPNVDYQDLVYKDLAPISNYNASVSSASQKSNYYFSLGYFDQEGILPKSDFERITAKLNNNYNIGNAIKVGLNLSISSIKKSNAPGVVSTALRAFPIDEPFRIDSLDKVVFAEVRGSSNSLAAIEYQNSTTTRQEAVSNLFVQYSFFNGFSLKSSIQFNGLLEKTKSFSPEYNVAPDQQNPTSDISQNYRDFHSLIFENTLSYSRDFDDKHRLNAVIGYTSQETRNEFLSGSAQNLLREQREYWYIDASDRDQLLTIISNNAAETALVSILARVNYSLLNKYLFTATYRRDGSSKFGENRRYGVFPSFALGWNITEESFFPQTAFIDNLKVRASWGIVGNEKIPGNDQFSTISSGQGAVFGDGEVLVPGASFQSPGNPNLQWEETVQLNFGVNGEFLNNKLVVEIDYYKKTTNKILVNLIPLGYTGTGAFVPIRYNVADVENQGFEFNLNWRDKIGEINYSVGALGSFIKNEVLALGQGFGADSVLIGGNLGNGQRVGRAAVGYPIGFFYGYEVAGVFQNTEQLNEFPRLSEQGVGDFIYRDTNGDGVLNTDDRTNIGNSIPDFTFGFNAAINYKGFTLSGDFQGQTGVDVYNGKQALRFDILNAEDKFLNRWTGEGTSNTNPRATQGGVNFSQSDYFVEDASYIRLRSLTLGYDLPEEIISRIKANQLRLYVRGTNLLTWTKYTGYSPDIGTGNPVDGVIDLGRYPITKVYSLGLNVTF